MTSCFMFGHREAPEALRGPLLQAVEHHITDCGVTEFIVGHYGDFDRMAAQAVFLAKVRHPAVRLTLLLPYYPGPDLSRSAVRFDGSYFPPGMELVPKRFAIPRANRYMLGCCGRVIAFVRGPGNARELLDHARALEKKGLLQITLLEAEDRR